MKRTIFIVLASIALLAACQKEQLIPKVDPSTEKPESFEKEMGNTKLWTVCHLYFNNKPQIEGTICKGEGNQCGRKSRCSVAGGRLAEPDEIFFMDLTQQQFVDLWETDEGMDYLMSKGVYVVEQD
jgi:hypothetical protein